MTRYLTEGRTMAPRRTMGGHRILILYAVLLLLSWSAVIGVGYAVWVALR